MLKFRILPLFVSASWILLSGFEFGDLLKGARDQVIKHTDKGISVERVLKSINDQRSEFQNMKNLEKCANEVFSVSLSKILDDYGESFTKEKKKKEAIPLT